MALTSTDNYKILIETDADTKGVRSTESALDRLRGSVDGGHMSFLKLSAAVAAGTAAFSLATTAATKLFGVVSDSMQAAAEAGAAQRQLEHAVLSVTKAKQADLVATMNLADELERKGVLDGDNIKIGLAQLSTFGLSNKAVQGLGKSLADLAVNQYGVNASGEQLSDTANMIAKALNGQFGVLEKSGIRFTEAQKNMIAYGNEMQKVQAINEGFAQNLKYTNDVALSTSEGKWAKFKVSVENVKESLGDALINGFSPLFDKLAAFVESDEFKDWVEKVAKFFEENIPKAIEYVTDEVIPKLKEIFDETWPVIKQFGDTAENVINWLSDHTYVIYGLVAAIGAVKTALAISAAVEAFKGGISTMSLAYKGFVALVTSPLAFPAIATAAVLGSIWAVYNAAKDLNRELDKANAATVNAGNATSDFYTSLRRARDEGRITQEEFLRRSSAYNGRASGGPVTSNMPYLVGENPDGSINPTTELFVPRTSGTILSAKKTQEVLSGQGSAGSTIKYEFNAPFYFQTAEAVREWFKRYDYNAAAAERGLSASRL